MLARTVLHMTNVDSKYQQNGVMIKPNSLSVVFFCSGLDGDGECRPTWESWFFSMWTPLQISWNVLGGLALPVSSVVFPAFPLHSLDELMLTSCSWEPLLPWLPYPLEPTLWIGCKEKILLQKLINADMKMLKCQVRVCVPILGVASCESVH